MVCQILLTTLSNQLSIHQLESFKIKPIDLRQVPFPQRLMINQDIAFTCNRAPQIFLLKIPDLKVIQPLLQTIRLQMPEEPTL
jgi:hypothetical protein